MNSKYLKNMVEKVKMGREVFIAHNATVLGNVYIGDHSSVWFTAVLRGDTDKIEIGIRTNIQDGAIIHCDPGDPVNIGNEVVVGHRAIIHGATIRDNTLIGMGATVLNGAVVGRYCIIGAHTLVTGGMEIPDYSVVMGVPGKIVKHVSQKQAEGIRRNAAVYVGYAAKYLE
jgi:carbonic anhydrase/acetyltransferase-like protein (isoleucine patch superfamily)